MTRTIPSPQKAVFIHTYKCLKYGLSSIDIPRRLYICANIGAGISIFEAVKFSLGEKRSSGKIVNSTLTLPLCSSLSLFSSFLPSQPATCTIYRMSSVHQWLSPVAESELPCQHFSMLGVMHTFFLVQGYWESTYKLTCELPPTNWTRYNEKFYLVYSNVVLKKRISRHLTDIAI